MLSRRCLVFSALATLSACATAPALAPGRLVAITFDDLPFAEAQAAGTGAALAANDAIRRVLVRQGVPAIGFVTESHVAALGPAGPRLLDAWLRDGLALGNHGATHADINALDLDEIEAEVLNGAATAGPMAERFGRPLSFYRFAYNHVGETEPKRAAIGALLTKHGYRLAAATIDTSDYLFDRAWTRAGRNRALRQRIERAYLDHSRAQIRYYAGLNARVLGYEPPAIMLLHLNGINGATLGRLLDLFRDEGYSFVSLERAQADPAYAQSPAVATRFGPMWGYRWARERRVKVDGTLEQEPPAWIARFAEEGASPG